MSDYNHPITSLNVTENTMVTAHKCAIECEQKFAVVSYDLAAATPAMQIQTTERPRFDVFIMPGAFHIQCTIYKAIGKIISESGGSDLLIDSKVLAVGFLNGFINANNFNRAKRMHLLLLLVMRIVHFKSFLISYENAEEFTALFEEEPIGKSAARDESINMAFEQYEIFSEETRSGKYGNTAKFWMLYLDYIQANQMFDRAVRSNDLDLYMSTV